MTAREMTQAIGTAMADRAAGRISAEELQAVLAELTPRALAACEQGDRRKAAAPRKRARKIRMTDGIACQQCGAWVRASATGAAQSTGLAAHLMRQCKAIPKADAVVDWAARGA